MASENTVTLVGNLTDDPELRYTPSGAAVCNFTVAVNKRFRGQDGQWEDRLDGFFRCNVWREMAENLAESLQKGMRVIVVGRLQQRSWETNEGQKRYEIEVQVDEVGPALRFATAQIQRSQRSGGGSGPGPQGGGGFGGGQGGGSQEKAPQQGAPARSGYTPPPDAGSGAVDDWGSKDMGEGGF